MMRNNWNEWLAAQRPGGADRQVALDRVSHLLETSLVMLDDLGLHQVAGHIDMGLQMLTQGPELEVAQGQGPSRNDARPRRRP